IMQNIVKLQFAVFSVFEPFLGGLITTNVKLPSYLRNIIKILCVIDEYFSIFVFWFPNHIISVNWILRNIIFNSWTFQQMDLAYFSAQFYQLPKRVLVFWIRNSREIYF